MQLVLLELDSHRVDTIQAICNITLNQFFGKKIHMNSRNFGLKFAHEIREKFVHEFVRKFMCEFMPEDYAFKERIWGKVSVSVSLIYYLHEILQCRVLPDWADTEIC